MANKKQPLPKTNPALERLGVLAGEWNVEMSSMSFQPDPSAIVHWRISFEWLEDGAFMIQHEEVIGRKFHVAHGSLDRMMSPGRIAYSTMTRGVFPGFTR